MMRWELIIMFYIELIEHQEEEVWLLMLIQISDCLSSNVEPINLECLFTNIIFHENKQLTIRNI